MLWLPTAQMATLLGSLLLTAVYTFLYFQERTRYMLLWSITWGITSVRYICSFLGLFFPEWDLLVIGTQLAVLYSGLMLLYGTRIFLSARIHAAWMVAAGIFTFWVIYGVYAGYSLTLYSAPVFLYSAVAYIYTGVSFLSMDDHSNRSARGFTGVGFIVWGLHKADYPLLRPVVWFAPWGYLIGAFLELFVAIGILLTYFQKNRYDLQISQQRLSKLNAELEKRVNERTERLEETVKELEAFSYSVSHDLRAPLRAISGFGEILVQEYRDSMDTEAIEYLDRILANSARMDELIKDLLMLSQLSKQEITFHEVDLTQLVQEVFRDLCEVEVASKREVFLEALATPSVLADRNLMRVVLTNLISNAIKFTRDSRPAQIRFGATEEDGRTVFFVRDNGIGFSMDFAETIFRPFQRLHSGEEFEGTGIGLATVHRGIERHNGRVWAESEVGRGTTIFFTLETRVHQPE